MTWVQATQNFNWKPKPTVTVAFKKGDKYNMPQEAAAKLIEEGKVKTTGKAKEEPNANVSGNGTAG